MLENRKVKILLVVPSLSSFIQRDLSLLRKYFDTKVIHYKGLKSIPSVLPRIIQGVFWADVTFSRFADNHAFLATLFSKIFRKKSIVVVGGYEVARLPELNYGLSRSPVFPHTVKYILNNADRVLTVSESLKEEAIKNVKTRGDNMLTLPNGYDYRIYKAKGKKEKLVLTVAQCSTWQRVRLKGLDTFVNSAKFFPNTKFLMIGIFGKALDKLRKISPSNVVLLKPLSPEQLIYYYQKAKVYCQLSRREGHPNTLCEAMLCECLPVGTDIPAIQTVIGETGYYVPYAEPEETAVAVERALESSKGEAARERIKTMFPLEKRERKLIEIISEI